MQDSLPGITISNENLRIRAVDNAPRYNHHVDAVRGGMSGLAALIDRKHHKNIFSLHGLHCEGARSRPANGKSAVSKECAPSAAPMTLNQTGPDTIHLLQSGSEASGLNMDIEFKLGARHVDQTVTLWSDCDIDSFDTFWSSQMNQVQCTSLFMQGLLQRARGPQWVEVTSAGYCADNRVYYRPFDPTEMTWADHVIDNPVRRQKPKADEESVAATLKAGFVVNEPNKCPFAGFYYGIIDDYCYLMIFREPAFYFWTCVAGAAQRNPCWDYGIAGGAMKSGERRAYHLRLVFKPYAGVEDILQEVQAFRGDYASSLCGDFATG